MRPATLGSSCFKSGETKKERGWRGGSESPGAGLERGCGKGKGGEKVSNLIKVVAYSGMLASKHVRLKATDVSTVCSLTSAVNICSGIGFHPCCSSD